MKSRIIGLVSPALHRHGVILWCICILLITSASLLAACATTASTVADAPNDISSDDTPLPELTTQTPPPDGDIAPSFSGVDVVTDETVSLSQFSGATVLLNFVNYGCSQSLNKIVSDQLFIIRTLKEQRDDFIPVSIFCGCCSPSVLKDFATQNNLVWPWILDSDNSIIRQYAEYVREYGYPTLVLIDRNQYVREVAGYTDLPTLGMKIDGLSQY